MHKQELELLNGNQALKKSFEESQGKVRLLEHQIADLKHTKDDKTRLLEEKNTMLESVKQNNASLLEKLQEMEK